MIKKFIPMPEIIYTCYPQSEIGGLQLFHNRAAVSSCFVFLWAYKHLEVTLSFFFYMSHNTTCNVIPKYVSLVMYTL